MNGRMYVVSAIVVAVMGASSSLAQPAYRAVVIGVDGLSPDGIRNAKTPNLDALMESGAYTLHARAVMPTTSSPNWASMIMGAGPEQHGVTSNEWQRDKFDIVPAAKGPEGIFPTLFGVLRAQRPASVIGVFHDWDGFGRLVEREACNVIHDADGPEDATKRAVEFLRNSGPTLTFIHLDHVDHAGHEHGHGTPEYYAAVEEADRYIGEIMKMVNPGNTFLLVTSDHGGTGKGHGGATMAEIEIPWIMRGPWTKSGHEIIDPVNTFDTAATLAYIFDLAPPPAWIARPVLDAFTTPREKWPLDPGPFEE